MWVLVTHSDVRIEARTLEELSSLSGIPSELFLEYAKSSTSTTSSRTSTSPSSWPFKALDRYESFRVLSFYKATYTSAQLEKHEHRCLVLQSKCWSAVQCLLECESLIRTGHLGIALKVSQAKELVKTVLQLLMQSIRFRDLFVPIVTAHDRKSACALTLIGDMEYWEAFHREVLTMGWHVPKDDNDAFVNLFWTLMERSFEDLPFVQNIRKKLDNVLDEYDRLASRQLRIYVGSSETSHVVDVMSDLSADSYLV